METKICLIDECMGLYIPNRFYRDYDFEKWGLKQSDFSELADPYHENYWDTWEELLTKALHRDEKGFTWTLDQDGDLFAIRNDHYEKEAI